MNAVKAMRPAVFGAVVAPEPWDQGLVLLPPTCVLRAYQLENEKCIADGPGPDGELPGAVKKTKKEKKKKTGRPSMMGALLSKIEEVAKTERTFCQGAVVSADPARRLWPSRAQTARALKSDPDATATAT